MSRKVAGLCLRREHSAFEVLDSEHSKPPAGCSSHLSRGSCGRLSQWSSSLLGPSPAFSWDSLHHHDKLNSQLSWARSDTPAVCLPRNTMARLGFRPPRPGPTPAAMYFHPPWSPSGYDDSFLTSVVTASSICLSLRPSND